MGDGGLSTETVKLGVIGAGAWGTSLALHAARKGHNVLLWALEKEVAEAINMQHENTMYFRESAATCPIHSRFLAFLGFFTPRLRIDLE
jgi:glycerol-3-phosphate dehydrogenase